MLGSDPKTFKESCRDPRWKAAMDGEFEALQEKKLGNLSPYLQGGNLFSENGSTRPIYPLMEPKPSTRIGWWPKVLTGSRIGL